MSESYYLDPAQQFFLELSSAKADADLRYFQSMATSGFASNLADYSNLFPYGSAELGIAASQGGIPAYSPEMAQLAQRELEVRDTLGPVEKPGGGWWDGLTGVLDEWVVNPIQGTVRWTFAAWDAAYQMLAGGAPIRAGELADQKGISYGEAWREQDPYFFEALGGLFSGESRPGGGFNIGNVNIGSGWFPNSDVTDSVSNYVNENMMKVEAETAGLGANERLVARLKAAPQVWREAVAQDAAAQAELGRPIVQQNYADTESVLFNVKALNGSSYQTPWSPGRIVAAHIWEPGTTAFNVWSGLGDFTAQVVADPVEWVGMGWAKMGKNGRRIWAEANKITDEARALPAGEQRAIGALPAPDPTRQAAEQLRLGVWGDEFPDEVRRGLYQTGLPGETLDYTQEALGVADDVPWWLSDAPEARVANWRDAPQWFIDTIRGQMNSARGRYAQGQWRRSRSGQKVDAHIVRRQAGVYEMELPRLPGGKTKKVSIRRRGTGKKAYWDVTLPDGEKLYKPHPDNRFSPTPQFRTLDEAQTAARKWAYGPSLDELKYKGMTVNEFLGTAEEFDVDEAWRVIYNTDLNPGRKSPSNMGHRVRTTKKVSRKPFDAEKATKAEKAARRAAERGGQARVTVYGKTLDLSKGVDDLPESLQAALRRDRKLRKGAIVGWDDPNLDVMDNTLKWMTDNGYGKIKFDEDTIVINDHFIGNTGQGADPLGRIAFQADTPIHRVSLADEALESPTPNQINDIVDYVASSGGRRVDEAGNVIEETTAGRMLGDRIKEVALGGEPHEVVRGVRNDVVPPFTLGGKKKQIFVDKLAAVSRAGGQTDTRYLDRLLRFLEKQGVVVPNEVRTALFEAPDRKAVESIFARYMAQADVGEILLPGGTQFGRLGTMTGYNFVSGAHQADVAANGRMPRVSIQDQHWFKRRWAKSLANRDVNMVEDPSKAYNFVLEALDHYNIDRGATITRFDPKTGEALEGVWDIEEILSRLRTMKPGNHAEAYNIMGDLNAAMFSSLVGEGVDPRLASYVSRWIKESGEQAEYLAEYVGRTNLSNGAYDAIAIDDDLVFGHSPALASQLWSGELVVASQKDIKRVANQSDLVGKMMNSLSARKVIDDGAQGMVGSAKFEDRVWYHYATRIMNRIWKPFVLLRGAWTIRILMDDQMRIAADGRSIINHPARVINYLLMNPKGWKEQARKGRVDVFGEIMNLNDVGDIRHGQLLKAAAMKQPDPLVGPGAFGHKSWTQVARSDPKYAEGMVTELAQLRASTLNKILANSTDDMDTTVARTVKWLQGQGGDRLAKNWDSVRADLAHLHKNNPEIFQKIMDGDTETLTRVVQKNYALTHRLTGGEVLLDTGNGQLISFDFTMKVDDIDPSGAARWVVREPGDEDLLRVVAGHNDVVGDLATDESLDALQKLIKRKVDNADPMRYPKSARVPKQQFVEQQGNMLDKAVGEFFNWFMTKPSNWLSRSPVFRDAYWDRMAKFYAYASPDVQRELLAKVPTKYKGAMKKATRGAGETWYVTDLGAMDEMAKAYGLAQVESTLFTLTNRRNISDSLNLMFPFVEAWGEFVSRWGRMMVYGDKNIANARRFQQVIEGARDSGFFRENEYGQEVFEYPAFLTKGGVALHNTLNNIIPGMGGDVSPEVAQNIKATGSVESLNFASGVIPGFGPVAQLAAKQFLPDDPSYDWVRDIVAPFGTSGGLLNQFAPAWVKRILSAGGGFDDPALQYTYDSTVADVLRTKMDSGQFMNVTSPEEINALVQEAVEEAKGVLMVRAAATFMEPASPSYEFQKEDRNGMWWSYSTLGNEYRKLEDEYGTTTAFDMFFERFGFLPQAFRGGKTYSVQERSLTESGYAFERANPELFNKYPGVAMYLDPNIGEESDYDHGAMLEQLRRGLRENWTPEQFIYIQHDMLGDMWYTESKRKASAIPDSGTRKSYLMYEKERIKAQYPYWNDPIPGRAQSVTNEQQMAEMQRVIASGEYASMPVVQAASQYEAYRREVLDQIERAGASTISGPKATDTEAGRVATYGREWLRTKAEELSILYPEFAPLYRSVYAREVSESHDEITASPRTLEPGSVDEFMVEYFDEMMGLNV